MLNKKIIIIKIIRIYIKILTGKFEIILRVNAAVIPQIRKAKFD